MSGKKINCFIKLIRRHTEKEIKQNNTSTNPGKTEAFTHIVIDALRNPYEVLYFRERYASFILCLSIQMSRLENRS